MQGGSLNLPRDNADGACTKEEDGSRAAPSFTHSKTSFVLMLVPRFSSERQNVIVQSKSQPSIERLRVRWTSPQNTNLYGKRLHRIPIERQPATSLLWIAEGLCRHDIVYRYRIAMQTK